MFPNLSVLENLEMGAWTRQGDASGCEPRYILTLFPVLEQRRRQLAGTLSGGEQQMVAIGRGLASSPALLMLDEPVHGPGAGDRRPIFERIIEIRRDKKLTVLLVEQRAVEALRSCDRGYVLRPAGRARGHPRRVAVQRPIRKAYLGM